jgi:hypothetical protein
MRESTLAAAKMRQATADDRTMTTLFTIAEQSHAFPDRCRRLHRCQTVDGRRHHLQPTTSPLVRASFPVLTARPRRVRARPLGSQEHSWELRLLVQNPDNLL